MLKPPLPQNESSRLNSLRCLGILDTPPEERYDRITRLAKTIFNTPIVLVSIVDENRQWFKSCQGLSASETPRDISFCGHAILKKEIFIVEDASSDPRFADNPLVSEEPRIRFYAGAPLASPDGKLMGTLCIIDRKPRKLSARKKIILRDLADLVENELAAISLSEAMVQLKDRQRELLDYFEHANISLHWVDANGIVIWANKTEMDLLGYSKEEYIGQPIAKFHADPPVINDILARLGRGETLSNYEARMRAKDGSIIIVSINSSVYRDHGAFLHTRCFTTDKTIQWNNELIQERFNSIIEGSDDAIMSKDINGVINSWNRSAEAIFGYTANEVIGKKMLMLIPKNRIQEETHILKQILKGLRIEHLETVLLAKNGQLIQVSQTIFPIRDRQGVIVGSSKIVRDITAKKLAEEKMLALVRAKSEFFSIISHELRTPLTIINECVSIIKDDRLGLLSKNQKKFSNLATKNVARLMHLIHDLLDFQKLEGKAMTYHIQAVFFQEMIKEALSGLSIKAKKAGVHLVLDVSDPKLVIHTDRDRVLQVICNLLDNAIKYSSPGMEVHLRTIASIHSVRLEIIDEAGGIKEKDLPKLFQSFSQVNPSVKTAMGGYGMGLAISRNIITQLGGSIDVNSEFGKGSTFHFTLPRNTDE